MVPDRAALVGSLAVVVPLAAGVAVAGWVGGPTAVLGVVLGIVVGLPGAMTRVPAGARWGVVVVAAGTAAAGLALDGSLVRVTGLVVLVAVGAIVQALASARGAGVGALLPAVPAVVGSTAVAGAMVSPWAVAVWLVAGGALVRLVARRAGVALPATPVPRGRAARHAVVVAAGMGGATLVLAVRDLPHGYWIVLTLAAALRPTRDETVRQARERVGGAVVGVLVAVGVLALVPAPLALALGGVAMWVAVAWALAGRPARQQAFLTSAVVLTLSSGALGPAVVLGAEKVLLTVAAALVAAVLATLLAAWEERGPETVRRAG